MTPHGSRFTADTVVGDAISADPRVIDRLAHFHPAFRRLRNPVIRRVMSRLVTLGEAARVAGVTAEAVVAAANGEEVTAAAARPDRETERTPAPDWVTRADPGAATHLDVRPLLEQGKQPLGKVLHAAAGLEADGLLLIEAPFDPVPLRRVLAEKGFDSHALRLAEDHWQIYCRRQPQESPALDESPPNIEAKIWADGQDRHIDVRGLMPPQPMLAVLKLIESADTGDTIILHHEREPLFLYAELAERGWSHVILSAEEDEVLLRLTRNPG